MCAARKAWFDGVNHACLDGALLYLTARLLASSLQPAAPGGKVALQYNVLIGEAQWSHADPALRPCRLNEDFTIGYVR